MRVGWQVGFELNPEEALDASRRVGIDEEMLLGVRHVVEHKALTADVFESFIKFETGCGSVFGRQHLARDRARDRRHRLGLSSHDRSERRQSDCRNREQNQSFHTWLPCLI